MFVANPEVSVDVVIGVPDVVIAVLNVLKKFFFEL